MPTKEVYSPHFITSNGILLYFKGFPEGQLGYQQQKSKFEGMKAYVPDFLGQNRIKPSEEIKVNFRGLRFFNKRHFNNKASCLLMVVSKNILRHTSVLHGAGAP